MITFAVTRTAQSEVGVRGPPATTGEAIDVPAIALKVLPRYVLVIIAPGARMLSAGPRCEKLAMRSGAVV